MKKLYVLLVMGMLFVGRTEASPTPKTGRMWSFGRITLQLNKRISWLITPGYRYEFWRSEGDNKGNYMREVFTGPVLTWRYRNARILLPIQYYYMGFPIKNKDKYFYTHNIDLRPTVVLRYGKWQISNKIVFHNTIYSSFYNSSRMRSGYSMLIKYFLGICNRINKKFDICVKEDPAWGIIKDNEAMPLKTGIGFNPTGFLFNRVFVGLNFHPNSSFSVFISYMNELKYSHDQKGSRKLSETGNYIFLLLSYKTKI
jgi:hypothetical protein